MTWTNTVCIVNVSRPIEPESWGAAHMKQALLPMCVLFCAGCLPGELTTGLPTVACNQLGTSPAVTTSFRASMPPSNGELAGKVYFVGLAIAAGSFNLGLDPQVTFITYPSSSVEIFHVGRKEVFITEGLASRCDSDQLAGVLAGELGKMAAERIVASPYLDAHDLQGPVHLEAAGDGSKEGGEVLELVHSGGHNERNYKAVRPDPRKLAQLFLERANFARGCLLAAQPLLDEAAQHHQVERSVKGLPPPEASRWTPAYVSPGS